jgi:glyoxylase-like metal-dependent hydrolase (beta-lactamase superfamily II)/rhodanese-related sulfurtransferase
MIFRQLFDAGTSTYTYLLADERTREAFLIDPVREQVDRDLKLLAELDLKLRYVLDTHVHADHVTAAGLLHERTGARTVASPLGASSADVHIEHGATLELGDLRIEALATPGHTDDSLSYRARDRVFTGDALLIRGCGRTDFQNGDPETLYDSITRVLFALPDDTRVYPGHDYRGQTQSTIGEEKRLNPRVAGKSRAEFAEIMRSLNLPPPAKLAEAVPANRAGGTMRTELTRAWDEAPTSVAGFRNLSLDQARALIGQVRIVDVREPIEYRAAHLPEAELVPQGTLRDAAIDWNRNQALLMVCRTGKRSAHAAADLITMGFQRVFNLQGGFAAWQAAGLPVEQDPEQSS